MKIKIKGTIIPDDYADVYDFFGISYTSPKMINLPDNKEDIEVEINSYGGDVYAGSEIYTMLKNHKGKVTVVISGIAASMASIIAMAGDVIKMSPTGQIMIHNVSTNARGDKVVLEKEARVLDGYDKTLANAYRLKTNLSEEELLELMNKETWLTPQDALKKGFIDEILFDDKEVPMLVAGENRAVILDKEKVMQVKKNILKGEEMNAQIDDYENILNEEEVNEKIEEIEEETEEESEEESEEETEEEAEEGPEEATNNTERRFINQEPENMFRENAKVRTFENELDANNIKIINGGVEPMRGYREAFLDRIRGLKGFTEDVALINENNKRFLDEFTHTTTNTPLVIPRTTADKIWKKMKEVYGVLEDVRKNNVPGEFRLVKHEGINAGDAKWYIETTPTEDEENAFGEIILKGHELSKAITISWKLRSMAMDDFENFLVDEISERMGLALGNGVTQGTGVNEPYGIVTRVNADTEQVVNVAVTGTVEYSEVLETIGKVQSGYKRDATFYANSNVIWTKLSGVMDKQGRPLFIPNKSENGVGNILGFTVKEDSTLTDDQVLFGNVPAGYLFNENEAMSMTIEEHAKARKTDYVGYMIADGDVIDTKAFALLLLTQIV